MITRRVIQFYSKENHLLSEEYVGVEGLDECEAHAFIYLCDGLATQECLPRVHVRMDVFCVTQFIVGFHAVLLAMLIFESQEHICCDFVIDHTGLAFATPE